MLWNLANSRPRHLEVLGRFTWFIGNTSLATALLILSHFGSAYADNIATRKGLITAASFSIALLSIALAALAVYRTMFPATTKKILTLGALYSGVALSGLPWAYLSAIVAMSLDFGDFRVVAQAGGIVGFLCWLRILSKGAP
jgi:hypothetical protein